MDNQNIPVLQLYGNVDAAIDELGALGSYNLFQIFILMIARWPVALNMFSVVFQGQTNPFRCQNEDYYDYTLQNATFTPTNISIDERFTSECNNDAYDIKDNTSSYTTCTAFEVQFLMRKDIYFVSDFQLVCERNYLTALSQTLITVGGLIGSFIFPYLADAYGRKPVLVWSSVLSFVTSLGLAFSVNYEMFSIFKFLIGVFTQGAEVASVGALAEVSVTRHRSLWSAFGGGLNWAISSAVLAPLAYLLEDYSWKVLQYALSAINLAIVILLYFQDETLRWLSANGRKDEMMNIFQKASRLNKVDINKVIDAYNNTPLEDESEESNMLPRDAKETPESNTCHAINTDENEVLQLKHLLTDPMLRTSSLFSIAAWFFNNLIFTALTLLSSSLPGNVYVNYTLSILIEIPASFYCYFFLDKYGRRKSFCFLNAISGITLILVGIVWQFEPQLGTVILILSSIGKFGITASFNVIYLYSSEIFPTNLRSTGMGIGYLSGSVGEMLSPFAGLLMSYVVYAPGLVFGVSSLALSFLPFFLPETTNRQLPRTLGEMKSWKSKYKSTDANGGHSDDSAA